MSGLNKWIEIELTLTNVYAGFDYNFNSIQDESNELFCAYRDMFNLALSQAQAVKSILAIWFPWIYWFFVRVLRDLSHSTMGIDVFSAILA